MLAPTYPVFFGVETRTAKLTAMDDPLVKLNAWINCEVFRTDLHGCMRRKGRATQQLEDQVCDSAYRSMEHEENFAADNMPSQICDKGTRGTPDVDAEGNQPGQIQCAGTG